MSHPNSPRVSPDSAASQALSHAGDDQASTTTTSAASGSTGSTGTQDAQSGGSGVSQLLSQAQGWLKDSGLQTTLGQIEIPEQVKRLASQAGGRWRQLSTTQKVVGGALLAAGGLLLLRGTGGKGSARSGGSQASTLHELLLFVNDRVEGYQRAASESKDPQLKSYYQQLVGQSQDFARQLNAHLRGQGGPETGTTLKGKFYRAWMETKAAVTGYSETAILGSNIYGEEWAIKAYKEALADNTLTGTLRNEVQRQYTKSQQTYQRLQQLQEQQQ